MPHAFLAAACLASLSASALAGNEPSPAAPPGIASIEAQSAIVIDALTGDPLFEKDADQQRQVASTQKLLTALLVAERGQLDAEVVVEKSDTQVVPSKLGLLPSDCYPRKDLLKALLVVSGNDVARCLARDHSGSVANFAAAMNSRAALLGMSNSHFANPSGLTEKGQYSTARDMARLAWLVLRDPILREIVRTREFEFQFADGKVRPLVNTNRLLRTSSVCEGMKTGFTYAAGRCLICAGTYQERSVIAVVLGSTNLGIWQDSRTLLHWALDLPEEVPPSTLAVKSEGGS
ncbi:MAG TPA: D-alanyl-D-alanine carboxypeptidase family protein [Verrucomicrobiales bacterium]|nr:D-alanyl-D-alanine carboxypeptidase family protein [Verrucomicrobiales bacterium]